MFKRNKKPALKRPGFGVHGFLVVGLLFGVLSLTQLAGSSPYFAGMNQYPLASLLAFGGQSEGIDVNQYNFACKPGGTYADAVWCTAYGGTYEGNVAAAGLHQDRVVMFKYTDSIGDYYTTSGLVTTSTYGTNSLSPSSVVHCPSGSVIQFHSASHTKNSPTINMMFDGSSHYWCELGGQAVDPVSGMEPGRALFPDVSWWTREVLSLEVVNGANYYKNTSGNYRSCPGVVLGPYSTGSYYCVDSTYSKYQTPIDGSAPVVAGMEMKFTETNSNAAYTGADVTVGELFTVNINVTNTGNATDTFTPVYNIQNSQLSNCVLYDVSEASNITSRQLTVGMTDWFTVKCDISAAVVPGTLVTLGITGTTTNAAIFSTLANYSRTVVAALTTSAPTVTTVSSGSVSVTALGGIAPNPNPVTSGAAFAVSADFTLNGVVPTSSPFAVLNMYLGPSLNFSKTNYSYLYSNSKTLLASDMNTALTVSVPFPANTIANGTYYMCGDVVVGSTTSAWACSSQSLTVGGSTAPTTAVTTAPTSATGWSLSVPTYIGTSSWVVPTNTAVTFSAFMNTSGTAPSTTANAEMMFYIGTAPNFSLSNYTHLETAYMSATTEAMKNGITLSKSWPAGAFADGTYYVCAVGTWNGATSSTGCATTAFVVGGTVVPTSPPTGTAGPTTSPTHVPPSPTAVPMPIPGGCNVGERCSIDYGWCNNGDRCHFSDGSGDFTCAEWGSSCPANTNYCGDGSGKGCREPGSTSVYEKSAWCTNSMSCYSDTQMYCQKMAHMMPNAAGVVATYMEPESCPAGFSNCRPDDAACTSPGSSSTVNNAYCSQSQTCNLPDGGIYCPLKNESCPTGTSVCRAGDTNCVEPNSSGPLNGWCGSGVQCYSSSDLYCVGVPNADPEAWSSAVCPAGYGKCRADDAYCLEQGEVCSLDSTRSSAAASLLGFSPLTPTDYSQCWCSSGEMKKQSSGQWKCVAWNQTAVVPPPTACLKVITPASNGKKCKEYSTSCLPDGWNVLSADQSCVDGVVLKLSTGKRKDELLARREKLQFSIRDYELRLKQLPDYAKGVRQMLRTLSESSALLKSLTITSATLDDVEVELSTVKRDILSTIADKVAELQPFFDWMVMKGELAKRIADVSGELRRVSRTSEYYERLKGHKEMLEKLFTSAEQKTTARELGSVIEVLRNELKGFSTIVDGRRGEQKDTLFKESLIELMDSVESIRDDIDASPGLHVRAEVLLVRLEDMIVAIQEATTRSAVDVGLDIVNKAYIVRQQIYDALGRDADSGRDDLLSRALSEKFEQAITDKVLAIADKMTNKLSVMMDEAFQNVVGQMAKLEKELSLRVEESVARLASVSEAVRTKMVEQKNDILIKVETMEQKISDSNMQTALAARARGVMDEMAYYNWCGNHQTEVASRMELMTLAIESGDLALDDVQELEQRVALLASRNTGECYEMGATTFRDIPTEQWYFDGAQFCGTSAVNNEILIQGYRDTEGKLLGEFGPANNTLRIEALTMFVRLAGHITANDDVTDNSIVGMPAWGWRYYNAAVASGIELPKYAWDKPITRIESADLLVRFFRSSIPEVAVGDAVKQFKDYATFSSSEDVGDVAAAQAVGIFKGSSDGNYYPYKNFLRSEYGTVVQRAVQNLGLSVESSE